jgi:hypothetical protein
MASKCKKFIYTALPLSILLISLFQLYFQYSSLMTPRNEIESEKDNRNSLISFMINKKRFDLNLKKIEESFEDNPLMNIDLLKNYTLKGFDKINEKRENKIEKRKLMLSYLMIYDIIFIIFIYIFIFGGFKSGIVTIIFQIFKLYFTAKRLKQSSRDICLCETVLNFFKNLGLRDCGLFTPEGFQILEFLFNYVIILDIIWLILIKINNNKKKGEYVELSEKIFLNDDDREDYKKKNDENVGKDIFIQKDEEKEQKILSNENNNEDNSQEDNNEDDENMNENVDNNEDSKEDDNINNEDNNDNLNNNNISENIDNNNKENNIINNIAESNNVNDDEDVKNSLKKEDNEEEENNKNEGNEEDENDDNKNDVSEEEMIEQETK